MKVLLVSLSILLCSAAVFAQDGMRTLSGKVVTNRDEVVRGATVTVKTSMGEKTVTSDAEGNFSLPVPREDVIVKISGKNIATNETTISANTPSANLRFEIAYVIPKIHEGLVISAAQLEPAIDRRNEAIYRDTLFSRDDQVFHTLDAGINAGQHEGGGKSLEIRRFGFNLDHGGVNGGLKVLVDNVQQNQGTQGHGQGYLGQLKSLTPELVQNVEILNGPFSAEYGDFSGLGVVHIRLKETLADQLVARFQGGSFDTYRSFLGYSPKLKTGDALIAYELSRSDGPFKNPLRYQRDNLTGNYIHRLSDTRKLGVKFNLGRNDFFSSGQIPLDQVYTGALDRFGFIDPDNGGRVRSGVFSAYYRQEQSNGAVFKVDGFVSRSLFDLWSNFTFFLVDPKLGDEIQQHDSRLQEGVNAQYLRPYKLFGQRALLIAGANYHDNQINVGLYPSHGRAPNRKLTSADNRDNADILLTSARARVSNVAGYVQQGIDLFHGHVHVEGGVRYDYFNFRVNDRVDLAASGQLSGKLGAARVQPKFNLSVTPTDRVPLTLYFNYGRGISSQDARGVVQRPERPRLSTTVFYQIGTAHNFSRFSLSTNLFLLDRSNEQVYIPDDGSFEFKGPTRAYGFELKTAVKLTNRLSFNAGITKVTNAFFRDYFFDEDDPAPGARKYVDSAPHVVGNAALTLNDWRGFSGSLRYRHTSNYRLDPLDPGIRAAGLDVIDFSLNRRLRRGVEFNLAIDNLTDKRYFETQNFFESRIAPKAESAARIHATPGYPRTFSVGVTFRLGAKD
jgi:outer membrane receptor protein involved in Fe transport